MMTREEFEQGYAERSGVTVEWLHAHNQHGSLCFCGEDGCKGWQMMTRVEELTVARPIDVSNYSPTRGSGVGN